MARHKNPVRTQFEANLLCAMAEAGIHDYSELAAKAKTTTATLQRICSGATQPSINTLKAIAAATGCKLDDLI